MGAFQMAIPAKDPKLAVPKPQANKTDMTKTTIVGNPGGLMGGVGGSVVSNKLAKDNKPAGPAETESSTATAPTTWTPPAYQGMSFNDAVGQVRGQLDPLYNEGVKNIMQQRYQNQLQADQIALARGGNHSGLAADAQINVLNNATNNIASLDANRASKIAEMALAQFNGDRDRADRLRSQAFNEFLGTQNLGLQRDQFQWNKDVDTRNFGYQQGRDTVHDKQWQQGFDQNKSQWMQEFARLNNLDKVSQDQWNKTFDRQGEQWDWSKALDVAAQTGLWDGKMNMPTQMQLAELMGYFNGNPTQSMQNQQWTQKYNTDRFNEDKRQFDKSNAIDLGQLDVSRTNAQANLNNSNKSSGGGSSTGSYKNNPDFGNDLSFVMKKPDLARTYLTNNAATFIQQYGYDGYKQLLAALPKEDE